MYDCIKELFKTEYDSYQTVAVGRSLNGKPVYGRNVQVDRRHDARDWNSRHGMQIVAVLTAESGITYEIWESDRLSCAVPVYGGEKHV